MLIVEFLRAQFWAQYIILFFINDLIFSIWVSKEALYADDCCIYTSSSSLEIVNAKLHCDVECIMRCSKHNEMVINSENSYTMLICTRHKLTHLA